MSLSAFEGLFPAEGRNHAAWVVAGRKPPPGVGFRAPIGFDSIARLHHPLADGRRWSEAVPAPEGAGVVEAAGEAPDAEEGRLDAGTVDLLVPLLAGATSTPGETHFGLWLGWGDLRPGAHMILYSTGGRRRPWPPSHVAWSGPRSIVPVQPSSDPSRRSWIDVPGSTGGADATWPVRRAVRGGRDNRDARTAQWRRAGSVAAAQPAVVVAVGPCMVPRDRDRRPVDLCRRPRRG